MQTPLGHNERGIGNLVLIGLIVVVVAAIGLVGLSVTKQKNTPEAKEKAAVAVAAKTASAECLKQYNDKDLCKFVGGYDLDKTSYKMVMSISSADGTGTSTYEVDGKGNTSMVGTSNGAETAMISLDGTSYLKDPSDGKWLKTPPSEATADTAVTNPTSEFKFSESTTAKDTPTTETFKKLGKEKCGKLTCFKYQMLDSTQAGATAYLWFDTKDYRMQRYTSKDATASSDIVFTYQAIKITAPSPTKDMPTAADYGIPTDLPPTE